MARAVLAVGLAVAALSALSGCGTWLNVQDLPPTIALRDQRVPTQRVYGGVRDDLAIGTGLLQEGRAESPWHFALGLYVLAVDLPLCILPDTATMPWMIGSALDRHMGYPRGVWPLPLLGEVEGPQLTPSPYVAGALPEQLPQP
jgi:hypothetical protein